jgi:two-component system sensor kinase FixL
VHLNPGELHSILINLINNAFDAVTDQRVNGPRVVQLDVRPDQDDRFVIEVIDSGVGIAGRDRSLVFAPFYTTKPHGMGIGLYLVQRLVNTMGGNMKCLSPNHRGGATFSVNLPRRIGEKE